MYVRFYICLYVYICEYIYIYIYICVCVYVLSKSLSIHYSETNFIKNIHIR